jgi:hypothetical protein
MCELGIALNGTFIRRASWVAIDFLSGAVRAASGLWCLCEDRLVFITDESDTLSVLVLCKGDSGVRIEGNWFACNRLGFIGAEESVGF